MNEVIFYLRLLRQRLPIMIALILLCTVAATIISTRMPTLYRANAVLLVEEAQIPDSMVRGMTEVDAQQQLEVIQRRLLTRANLLDVARTNQVFADERNMNPDDIVREMRARTNVKRASGRNRATVMNISFGGPDARQVAAVVNQYVTIALDANSSFRTQRAQGTLDFFQQEVERAAGDLRLQNEKFVNFKNEAANALPESFQYRLSRRTTLQDRARLISVELEQLQEQRKSVTAVFESTGAIVSQSQTQRPEERQLASLEAELRTGLAVYSEQNPRIRLLRSQIDALQEQINAQTSASNDTAAGQSATTSLDRTLAEIDGRAENLKAELAQIQAELEPLQVSLDRTPTVRIQLDAMERERQNLTNIHNEAVQRLNQARIAERIVLSAKGQRISVLEPPSVPSQPSSPNRMSTIGMGFLIGTGLAAAFFVLLELTNRSIRRPEDIISAFDVAPLMTLPRIETKKQRFWRRMGQVAILIAVIVLIPVLLWVFDTYYMPLDQLMRTILERFL